MLSRLRTILEMIRFSHTLFALPFALLAAVMAWTAGARSDPPVPFRWQDLLGIVLCMVTARSAAMAFNRIADWRFDADNPRTAKRHIPVGALSVSSVATFAIASAAAFVASTLIFLPNRLPIYLSLPVLAFLLGYSYTKRFTTAAHFWLGAALMLAPISAWIAIRGQQVMANPLDLLPVLAFLLGYSYTKRFTAAAHFWLGAALMLAPISAWIAIRGQQIMANPLDLLPAAVLGGAVLLWVAGFDVIYACQDVEFDRATGLRSVPARLGVARALRLATACHFGMVLLLAALPWVFPPLGWIYGLGVAAVALLLIYEHSLVRPDDLDRVNVAFFNVNAVVSIGLFAVTSLDLLTSASLLR